MKIFQVKYNTQYYCYYKAEKKELINTETKVYKTYNDCSEDKNNIIGIEEKKIIESLIKHFKN